MTSENTDDRVQPAALRDPTHPHLVGVVHLLPLPGSPGASRGAVTMQQVLEAAERDATALAQGGVDGLIVENFGDAPFFAERVPPETVAAMALAVERVRVAAGGDVDVGVNVLRNDVRAALGVAAPTGAAFVRVNVHCGSAVTDQGLVHGRAAETLRERERLAPQASIWADVHVKHAVPLAGGDLAEAAVETWSRGRADALIVSGCATGAMPDPRDIASVRGAVPDAYILIGSGLTEANAESLVAHADGAICGTALKMGGDVYAPVERSRVEGLRAVLDGLRR